MSFRKFKRLWFLPRNAAANFWNTSALPDAMIPAFGHHYLPLLSSPEVAGALGGKAHLTAVKEACKSAGRINGALTMAGRFEVAVVSCVIDFFDPAPGMAKARNHAWERIRNSPRLQWVILTRHPELISTALLSTWIGKGFQNVCLGLVADGADGFPEKLQALRKAPVQRRMIYLSHCNPAMDLSGQLGDIDWVVFTGNSEDSSQAAVIEAACREANVAFLFHQPDGDMESSPVSGSSEDELPWPVHPFGKKIDFNQPTLPALKPVLAATLIPSSPPADEENKPEAPCPAILEVTDSPVPISTAAHALTSEPPTEIVKFEVVPPETAALDPDPALPVISGGTHEEFTQLDGVVRSGLGIFMEVSHALAQIRDRELWRAGGHTSWAAYCLATGGLTKSHANRLIKSAEIAGHLQQVAPIGATPRTESQVLPLCRLKTQELQVTAWSRAVERASGSQPTASLVTGIVAELMAEDSPPTASKPTHKQFVAAALGRLRSSVTAKDPVEQIYGLITELEKLLKSA
jgi:hypothetical protein